MKTSLDTLMKLHYELNLDNFFASNVYSNEVDLLGYYSSELEKLLFDKGYQVEWIDNLSKYKYKGDNFSIVLFVK